MSHVAPASEGGQEHLALTLGKEAQRVDAALEGSMGLDRKTRGSIWESVSRILSHGPLGDGGAPHQTGLALGYVQSGKTTSITSLIALAADQGYRIVIALLGVTNLLLDQNAERITKALALDDRTDYRWVPLKNPAGASGGREVRHWLDRNRTILIPVLKHSGRIRGLADALGRAAVHEVPVIIIDDEADQASLNTRVRQQEVSNTYAAIAELRESVPNHLYVQYTATPYAPLLLAPDDDLRPEFVEVLQPGPGYTGGREFFVDHASRVVRPIPTLDEQPPKGMPIQLPGSLVQALGTFVAGSALLLTHEQVAPPISMLIHSTYKTDVQARYRFLIERKLRQWRKDAERGELASDISAGRLQLARAGATDVSDEDFLENSRLVLREATLWLVNSASDVRKIQWHIAPIHVLVGGNKLDRGFTVEGLTVTYMNRPASPQIDTIEQRARAFGYRSDLLPYCQFYATPRTLDVLRDIVFTEYDLRAELEDWLDRGNSVAEWARHIGLMLPEGTKPTRESVIEAMSLFNDAPSGWHSLRRPDLNEGSVTRNHRLVEAVSLPDAPSVDYGRVMHPTLMLPLHDVIDRLLQPWATASYSPGWRHDDILQYLRRREDQMSAVPILLMQQPGSVPRVRKWDPQLGFVNLFQGRDIGYRPNSGMYPGDQQVIDLESNPDQLVLQVHRVVPASSEFGEVFTLAIRLGSRVVARRGH